MDATQPFDSEEKNKVKAAKYFNESSLVIGYAYIPESPFILMIVKNKEILFKSWHNSMIQLVSFLIISVVAIIIVVLGGITFLVNQIYLADHRRLMAMHKVEYANKMASLGQLSAGVAHEINNPLAIINEKAGLIKDIFSFNEEYSKNLKLIGLVDSIISSVERCSGITRRLLNFARHSDMKMVPIRLKTVIEDVLSFVRKEAEYRGIEVGLIVAENIPVFESDQGKLQEIFLNLITNAFAAMNDNGSLNITATLDKKNYTAIHFSDDGHGIADEDLERIFEPFFSTRIGKGGTGLGLSITYGLVQELGGRIEVVSQVGVGTTFTVILPLKPPEFRKSPGDSRLNTEKKDGNSFEYPSDFGI
jgi:signal transduction histidine kinase